MKKIFSAFLVVLMPLAAQADTPIVPSGQPLSVHQTLTPSDAEGLLYLSFVAPNLAGGSMSFEIASMDMDALCEEVGIPQAKESVSEINEIVIRLFAEPIDYGTSNPDVVQYLAAYDISTGRCAWI
ncbi:MAG: DUF6497 family protein [Pseudomonadota bacterium]